MIIFTIIDVHSNGPTMRMCNFVKYYSNEDFPISSREGGKISELLSNTSSSRHFHIIIRNDYFYIASFFSFLSLPYFSSSFRIVLPGNVFFSLALLCLWTCAVSLIKSCRPTCNRTKNIRRQ